MSTSRTPFPKTDALNTEHLASIVHMSIHRTQSTPSNPDSPASGAIDHIPGEPNIVLIAGAVEEFLRKELETLVLDDLFEKLWLVAKKSSGNIDALHRQIIKGRDIITTEETRLHLVWQERGLFVKPMPPCLLNYDFWQLFLCPATDDPLFPDTRPESLRRMALGFLRTYALLIQHRSDLYIAKAHHLVPDTIDWDGWSRFAAHFRRLDDGDVARRYLFGQLRLNRLNWATRIWRPAHSSTVWFYEEPHWSTLPYIREAATPLAFVFASFSLILSSMQVMLAVPDGSLLVLGANTSGIRAMQSASWGCAIAVTVISSTCLALLILVPSAVLLLQLLWAIRHSRG